MFGIIIFFGMVFSTVVGWDWIMWLKDNRPPYFEAVRCLAMGWAIYAGPRAMIDLGLIPSLPELRSNTDAAVADQIRFGNLDKLTADMIQYGAPVIAALMVVLAVIFVIQGMNEQRG